MNINITRTKKVFKSAIANVIKNGTDELLSEAAFPAYAHPNPLIDHLFWKRLSVAAEYIEKKGHRTILDFGCGSGVFTYALALDPKNNITGFDTVYEPLTKIRKTISFPLNVTFIPDLAHYDQLPPESFDAIVALDVLEHVEDLAGTLEKFKKLLKPKGEVLISGPTENILYSIGRKIAGKEFSGSYHRRNIADIEATTRNIFSSKTPIQTLYPLLPFFKLFAVGTQQK